MTKAKKKRRSRPLRKIRTPLSAYLPTAIRQALADVEAVEKSNNYSIDMACWHKMLDDVGSPCHVCLAGAAVARRTAIKKHEELFIPTHRVRGDLNRMIGALDYVRKGVIAEALRNMWSIVDSHAYTVTLPQFPPVRRYRSPEESPADNKLWKMWLLSVAEMLDEWLRQNYPDYVARVEHVTCSMEINSTAASIVSR